MPCSQWGAKASFWSYEVLFFPTNNFCLWLRKMYGRFSQGALLLKNLPAEDLKMWIPSLGQVDSPGGGHGNPVQYSCPENPMDRGAWRAAVHEAAKSQIQLSDWTMTSWHWVRSSLCPLSKMPDSKLKVIEWLVLKWFEDDLLHRLDIFNPVLQVIFKHLIPYFTGRWNLQWVASESFIFYFPLLVKIQIWKAGSEQFTQILLEQFTTIPVVNETIHVPNIYSDCLTLDMLGEFTPWKPANTVNQGFLPSTPESWSLNIYQWTWQHTEILWVANSPMHLEIFSKFLSPQNLFLGELESRVPWLPWPSNLVVLEQAVSPSADNTGKAHTYSLVLPFFLALVVCEFFEGWAVSDSAHEKP